MSENINRETKTKNTAKRKQHFCVQEVKFTGGVWHQCDAKTLHAEPAWLGHSWSETSGGISGHHQAHMSLQFQFLWFINWSDDVEMWCSHLSDLQTCGSKCLLSVYFSSLQQTFILTRWCLFITHTATIKPSVINSMGNSQSFSTSEHITYCNNVLYVLVCSASLTVKPKFKLCWFVHVFD